MQSLSRTTWSRKVLPMVLDTARPKYKENTTWIGMRGRNAVRKSIPKVNILQVFTIDFSEIQFIVNHKSQSDGQNKSAKSGMNLHKKTIHVISLQRKGQNTKDNGILLETKQAKMCLWNFDLIFEPLSPWKTSTTRIRRTSWRAHPSRSTKTNTTRTRSFLRRLLVQRSSWPTYRMGILDFIYKFLVVVGIRMELEVSSKFCFILLRSLFSVTVGFGCSR